MMKQGGYYGKAIFIVVLSLIGGGQRIFAQTLLWEHWYPEVRTGEPQPKMRNPYYSGIDISENQDGKLYVTANLGVLGMAVIGLNADGSLRWESRIPIPATVNDSFYFPQTIYINQQSNIVVPIVRAEVLFGSFLLTQIMTKDGDILQRIYDTNRIDAASHVTGRFESGYFIAMTEFFRALDSDPAHFDDARLCKQDSLGLNQWEKFFAHPKDSILRPTSLIRAPDGDLVLYCNLSDKFGTRYDNIIFKTDSSGNLRWSNRILSASPDYVNPRTAIGTSDGGVLAMDDITQKASRPGDTSYQNTRLTKYTVDGKFQWQRFIRSHRFNYCFNVLERPRQGFILLGAVKVYRDTIATDDHFVVGTDAEGTQQWDWIGGSVGQDRLFGGILSNDGNLIITGDRANDTNSKASDFYIAKLQLPALSVPQPANAPGVYFGVMPNPAGTSATIRYTLPQKARLHITVVNALGQVVERYDAGGREAGEGSFAIRTEGYNAGVYRIRLEAGGVVCQTGLVVIR